VAVEKANHSVNMLCRVLKVSRSGFYAWHGREPSQRALADAALRKAIVAIHSASRETYGVPRVHAELRSGRGIHCSRKRVARLMREEGIQGISRRRTAGCTRRNPKDPLAPDLVQRDFTADVPNRLWMADITQHPTAEGWLYCAAVMDAFSRRIVGWSMGDRIRVDLVLEAVNMATRIRRPEPGTIHHSDHGAQYTSLAFGQRLREAGLVGSMGSIGDCYDNAMMESFWATLQLELLDRQSWPTRALLRSEIFSFIEGFYNRQRRHSSIGMLTPDEFERRWVATATDHQAHAS
jgi:transposase InsO family protein